MKDDIWDRYGQVIERHGKLLGKVTVARIGVETVLKIYKDEIPDNAKKHLLESVNNLKQGEANG